jgi:hypothetical protein
MWRTNLGPSHLDGYEGEDGEDADADEEEETSDADDGSMQNVNGFSITAAPAESETHVSF